MTNPTEQQSQHPVPVFLDLAQEEDSETHTQSRYVLVRLEKGIEKRTRRDGKGKPSFDVQVWANGETVSKTFHTITDARKWRDQKLGERAVGKPVAQPRPRLQLREFMTEWNRWLAEEVEFEHLVEASAIWYRYGARLVVEAIGSVRLSQMSANSVRGMTAELIRGGASNSKVRQARATLRSILWLAYEQDIISQDPTTVFEGKRSRKRKAPQDETPPPRAWGEDEAQQFIEFIRGDELEALWVLYLSTGLRRGEALGLEWDCVSFIDRTVEVRSQLCIVGRELRFQKPKTPRSSRTIAVGPITTAALESHRARQVEARLAADSWNGERDLVFSDSEGGPLRPDHITKRFKRLVGDAGLEWIRLHGLRHTMASLALQNGIDIATVSQRLGHSDTNVTARIYLHGSVESDRSAATALDGIIGTRVTS